MSIAAYKKTIRESESPRQIERRILSRVTGEMEGDAAAFDRATSRAERLTLLAGGLRGSLHDNQKFWSAVKADLSQDGNALPHELRAQLISLALWVERQTSSVLGGGGGIAALVSVNRSIIDGLAGVADAPRDPAPGVRQLEVGHGA